jgi:hypothetical protein
MNPKVSAIASKIRKLVELEKPKLRPFKPVIISDIDGSTGERYGSNSWNRVSNAKDS